jgi:hypothetical protein
MFPALAGFKFKEGVPLIAGLTTPYDLLDLRGRHEYIEYFEDLSATELWRIKI